MNRKYKTGLKIGLILGIMMLSKDKVYAFTEIPNEELDIIVQEGDKIPSATPTPFSGQYEYNTEKYSPDENDKKQNASIQDKNNQNVSNSNANNPNVNNSNANSSNANGSNANNSNANNSNANSSNANNSNANSSNTNNTNADNSNANSSNANSSNTNSSNTNNQNTNSLNTNNSSTNKQNINSQNANSQKKIAQTSIPQKNTIIMEESNTEIIEEPIEMQANAPIQEAQAQQADSINKKKQTILKKIATIDTLLETFAQEDVLSENPRSELYGNSNYVIMSKNGEFLSITAVMIVLLILLAIKLH